MALVHHAVRKMENRTWPITASPKMTVAISTASMMEARLGSDPMRHRWGGGRASALIYVKQGS